MVNMRLIKFIALHYCQKKCDYECICLGEHVTCDIILVVFRY